MELTPLQKTTALELSLCHSQSQVSHSYIPTIVSCERDQQCWVLLLTAL